MSAQRQLRPQAVVVLGFLVSAVAGVIAYIDEVTSNGYQFSSFRDVPDPMLPALTALAAFCAWSWLIKVDPRDEVQLKFLHRAYLYFALQYALVAAGYNFIFAPFHRFGNNWVTTSLWLNLFGALLSALGFFLCARILSRVRFDGRTVESDAG